MITQPNQYTLSENGVTYGLHTFKDGVNATVICQLHASGEWITLLPPTDKQISHFVAYGVKAVPVVVERKADKVSLAEADPLANSVSGSIIE